MTKLEAIAITVKSVAKELNCSIIEAASKMQAQCVKSGKVDLLDDLIEYKSALIEVM
jgi:hypothetical protein